MDQFLYFQLFFSKILENVIYDETMDFVTKRIFCANFHQVFEDFTPQILPLVFTR